MQLSKEKQLSKEQEELWDEEYMKYSVMAKLFGGYISDKEVSFDAYKAYDYLKRSYKLNQRDERWIIKDRDRIRLHVDEYQNNSQQDLLLRKEYMKNRIKLPRMDLLSRTFCGLMHLAKVIGYGYDPVGSNWDFDGTKIVVAGAFPLDRYRTLFIFKSDARVDEDYL
jgi:hypothetical protein